MKINWFTIVIVLLFVCASIQEIVNHNIKLALFYLFSASINAVVIWMK
jgi:hypothetical protein